MEHTTKNRILTLTIFTLLTFSSSSVVASFSTQYSIALSGSIKYPATATVTVDGKYLNDGQRKFLLRGFNLWDPNVFEDWRAAYSAEAFQQIKDRGYNVISIIASWPRFEPYEDQPGVWDEENLQDVEQTIEWCADAGLYVVINIRIMNMWWSANWEDQAYTLQWILTQEARDRYQNMLSMVVQRFDSYDNVLGFNSWFFPFHGYAGHWWDPVWEDYYNNVFTPLMVNTIRAHSNKIIFYAPCYQGGTPGGDTFSESCDTGQFAKHAGTHLPLADTNVVYGHRLHRGRGVGGNIRGVEDGDEWDYDYSFLEFQLQPAIDFMNTYNVPVAAIEWGLGPPYPPEQSRLDCQDYKLHLMNNTGSYHWTYWLDVSATGPIADQLDYWCQVTQ